MSDSKALHFPDSLRHLPQDLPEPEITTRQDLPGPSGLRACWNQAQKASAPSVTQATPNVRGSSQGGPGTNLSDLLVPSGPPRLFTHILFLFKNLVEVGVHVVLTTGPRLWW